MTFREIPVKVRVGLSNGADGARSLYPSSTVMTVKSEKDWIKYS